MSDINTDNIDINFPVAGQDNDSQGLRNNFANIVAALNTANDEISAQQSNLFSSSSTPLTPLGVDGDRAGMLRLDAGFIYFCFVDWEDGTNAIWVRSEIKQASSPAAWV